jgi:HK97 family phage prohead protease
METRLYSERVQLRSAADGAMRVGGLAARFNIASNPIPTRSGGSFQEVLKRTAFSNVLGPDLDCVALINHDQNRVLGRTTSRTLRLSTDSLGLQFECDLSPNISFHRDLYESVKRGDMNACSFAFQVDEDEWSDKFGEYPVRTIHSVKALRDVSVVTDPAYPHTEVGIRSDVDLAEVRSRFSEGRGRFATPSKRNWREVPVWRSTCMNQGLDPDTASLEQLGRACQRSIDGTDDRIVARRRSIINDLIL